MAEPASLVRITAYLASTWMVVSGELDYGKCSQLTGRLEVSTGRRACPRVAVDLACLKFCDSPALRCLALACRRVRGHGGEFVLLRLGDLLRRKLVITGVAELVPVVKELPIGDGPGRKAPPGTGMNRPLPQGCRPRPGVPALGSHAQHDKLVSCLGCPPPVPYCDLGGSRCVFFRCDGHLRRVREGNGCAVAGENFTGLAVQAAWNSGEVTVTVRGEIDMRTVSILRDCLDQVVSKQPARVIVDLAAVSFLDSSAVHVFTDMRDALDDHGALVLRSPQQQARRIFELTGLDALCVIE